MESPEHVLGHAFQRPDLLTMALTHASISYESACKQPDNQRLEFLGDAVLQLTLTRMIYDQFPEADEGQLTQIRAQLVSTRALARIAKRLDLGRHLILGRGDEAHGGRQRESTLADTFEAVAGAIYLDGGIEAAQNFVRHHFEAEFAQIGSRPEDQNPKGQLQEIIQSLSTEPLLYQILDEHGPDHSKSFEAEVLWQGHRLGHGTGRSKKIAETEAARSALADPQLQDRLKRLIAVNNQ